MHKTKETNSNQTTTVQERTCWHQRKQYTRCIVLGENVLQPSIENDCRCKQNEVSKCSASV